MAGASQGTRAPWSLPGELLVVVGETHNHSRGKCKGLCCTNPRPRETWTPSPPPPPVRTWRLPLATTSCIPLDRLKIVDLSPPEKGACLPRLQVKGPRQGALQPRGRVPRECHEVITCLLRSGPTHSLAWLASLKVSPGPPRSPPVPTLSPGVMGRGRDGWALHRTPSDSSFWAREVAHFPIFSFQLFLGILNFALQSEGSKEWLPWQPFPCFCHQGTQDSV